VTNRLVAPFVLLFALVGPASAVRHHPAIQRVRFSRRGAPSACHRHHRLGSGLGDSSYRITHLHRPHDRRAIYSLAEVGFLDVGGASPRSAGSSTARMAGALAPTTSLCFTGQQPVRWTVCVRNCQQFEQHIRTTNIQSSVTATHVPEPATLALLGLGSPVS